jgi:hypothetical protein
LASGFDRAKPTRINETARNLHEPNITQSKGTGPLPVILGPIRVRHVPRNTQPDRFLTDTRVRALETPSFPGTFKSQGSAATAIVSVSGTLLAG